MRKRKGRKIGKEEIKLPLYADSIITCLKDTIDIAIRFFDLINTFINVPRCKLNIQKSVAFLYANNELSVWCLCQ